MGCNDTMGVMQVKLLGTYSHRDSQHKNVIFPPPTDLSTSPVIARITCTGKAEQ